jgi:hypothetical protein
MRDGAYLQKTRTPESNLNSKLFRKRLLEFFLISWRPNLTLLIKSRSILLKNKSLKKSQDHNHLLAQKDWSKFKIRSVRFREFLNKLMISRILQSSQMRLQKPMKIFRKNLRFTDLQDLIFKTCRLLIQLIKIFNTLFQINPLDKVHIHYTNSLFPSYLWWRIAERFPKACSLTTILSGADASSTISYSMRSNL